LSSSIAPGPVRNVLIAGATGLIGSALLAMLEEDRSIQRVVVVARRSAPRAVAEKVDWHALELTVESIAELEAGVVDAVCCCLGTTIAKAGSREEFRRVDLELPLALGRRFKESHHLVVTAVGSSSSSPVFYSRVKGELEQALAALDPPSLHVFRPSILLGERAEFRRGERIGMALMSPLGPLFAGPLARYRGIRGEDVARAMQSVLHAPGEGRYVHEYADLVRLAAGGWR
jgi:uncharacterized protein YbjT (DUF2867 family)